MKINFILNKKYTESISAIFIIISIYLNEVNFDNKYYFILILILVLEQLFVILKDQI